MENVWMVGSKENIEIVAEILNSYMAKIKKVQRF